MKLIKKYPQKYMNGVFMTMFQKVDEIIIVKPQIVILKEIK